MNKYFKYVCEGLVIAGLLLTNVIMGNFTRTALTNDMSVGERIIDALSLHNIAIALVVGLLAGALLWHVIRK